VYNVVSCATVDALFHAVFRYAFRMSTFMSTADVIITSSLSMSWYRFTLADRS